MSQSNPKPRRKLAGALKTVVVGALAALGQRRPAGGRAPPLPRNATVLLFQGGGMGDVVRIFPLVASIRAALPAARIVVLAPQASAVFELYIGARDGLELCNYDLSGRHRGWRGKLRLLGELRRTGSDLVINPARGEGMVENDLITFASGIRTRVGFVRDGAGALNSVRVPLEERCSILTQNLALLTAVGIAPSVDKVQIAITPAACEFGVSVRCAYGAARKHLIGIHPGANWRAALRWPLDRFAGLIQALLARGDCTVVILGGTDDRSLAVQLLAGIADPRLVSQVGATSLTELCGLIAALDLFIGNDSGLLHLADAIGCPAIGLFGYTLPAQVLAPCSTCVALHRPADTRLYLHQPFFSFDPATLNPIEAITVAEVQAAAAAILARR